MKYSLVSLSGPAGGVHEGLGWAGWRVQGPWIATQGIQRGGLWYKAHIHKSTIYPPSNSQTLEKCMALQKKCISGVTHQVCRIIVLDFLTWALFISISEIPTGCDQEVGEGDRGEPLEEGGGGGGGRSSEGLDEEKRSVGPNAGGFTETQIALWILTAHT